jgi:hypothetical protein
MGISSNGSPMSTSDITYYIIISLAFGDLIKGSFRWYGFMLYTRLDGHAENYSHNVSLLLFA